MRQQKCINTLAFLSNTSMQLPDESPECLRKMFIIKLFGVVGLLFTLPFGLASLFNGNHSLAFILILISILLISNYFLISRKSYYKLAANIIVYIFLVLFLYLVYSGGVANTGALWIYAFPALALFLHGLKKGLFDIAIFVMLLTLMFIGLEDGFLEASYTSEYKIRLIFSFLVVTFLSSLYEYSNSKSFTEMGILAEKLINVAKQDQLTELANRRGIHDEMQELYQEAKESNEHLCVMLCDIDFLHDINDGYGHEVGDMVIKEVANEIQNSINNTHTVARWSGEEFLILLPQTKLQDTYKFARALEKRIENLVISYDREQIQVSLSIGVSDIEKVNSIYSAVRRADNEMYQVKKSASLA